jgi:hypothetical protein
MRDMSEEKKKCKHCWHSGLREITVIEKKECDSNKFKWAGACKVCCECGKEKL